MPAKTPNGTFGACKRCGKADAKIYARQDYLCQECFIKFVNTKVVKRMEAFRVRNASPNAQRNLLLPISGGVSSTTLLHVLDGQFRGQVDRTGRAGFQLHVLLVDSAASDREQSVSFFEAIKQRYPRHDYHRVDLLEDESQSSHDSHSSNVGGDANDSNGEIKSSSIDVMALLTSLPSSTSRADVLNISLTRTITRIAKELSCEAILWGSTTTRLAERILAETAKGRGFSLPWLVNDGESPYYGIHFLYPMKDLLRKELPPYADAVDLPLMKEPLDQTSAAVTSKNVTIDGLMKEYFESVEENYPSIVTNVVRTSGKLSKPEIKDSSGSCKLCGMPVANEAYGLHGWGGSDEPETLSGMTDAHSEESSGLCYGCARSLLNVPKSRPG